MFLTVNNRYNPRYTLVRELHQDNDILPHMKNNITIELAKEYFHFSAAHFTIFSATNRERLHGHNYRVAVRITGAVDDNGLCFDYIIFKNKIRELCQQYDEYTLIPEFSPHLNILRKNGDYQITHNRITLTLPVAETLIVPVRNITIEELARHFLDQMLADKKLLRTLHITAIEIAVSSGPKQWGECRWTA